MRWDILLFIFGALFGLCALFTFLGMAITIWRDLLLGW